MGLALRTAVSVIGGPLLIYFSTFEVLEESERREVFWLGVGVIVLGTGLSAYLAWKQVFPKNRGSICTSAESILW
jgi:hypothetical protein